MEEKKNIYILYKTLQCPYYLCKWMLCKMSDVSYIHTVEQVKEIYLDIYRLNIDQCLCAMK